MLRRIFLVLAATTLAGALVVAVLLSGPGRRMLVARVQSTAAAAGYRVQVGRTSLVWPPAIVLDDLEVAAAASPPFLVAPRVAVSVRLPGVSSAGLRIDVVKPLLRPADWPRSTAADEEAPAASFALAGWLSRLEVTVTDGRIETAGDDGTPARIGPVSASFAPDAVADGLRLQGRAPLLGGAAVWKLLWHPGDEVVELEVVLSDLRLLPVSLEDSMAERFRGPLHASISLAGPLAESLEGTVAATVGGADPASARLQGTVAIDIRHATAEGSFVVAADDADRIACKLAARDVFKVAGLDASCGTLAAPGQLLAPLLGSWTLEVGEPGIAVTVVREPGRENFTVRLELPAAKLRSGEDLVAASTTLALTDLDPAAGRADLRWRIEDLSALGAGAALEADRVVAAGPLFFDAGGALRFKGQVAFDSDAVVEAAGVTCDLSGKNFDLDVDSGAATATFEGRALAGAAGEIAWTIDDMAGDLAWGEAQKVELHATGFSFQDPGFERVGEKLSVDLEARGAGTEAQPVEVRFRAGRGALLYRRLYLEADAQPLSIAFALTGRGEDWQVSDGSAGVGNLLRLRFELLLPPKTPEGASGKFRLDVLDARAAFDLFVRETFGGSYPSVAALVVDGRFDVEAEFLRGGESWRRLGLRLGSPGLDLASGDTFAASDLEIDLAIAPVGAPGRFAGPGFLRFGELRLFGEKVAAQPLLLVARDAFLETRAPWAVEGFGGRLGLEALKIDLAPDAPTRLRASLAMTDAALGEVTRRLGLPVVEGTLTGVLDPVELVGDRLTTRGSIRAGVFAGQVEVVDPGVDALGSRVPEFRAAKVTLEDIDLGRVTEALPIGHVSGILRGVVEGLAVAAGEPVAFDAFLETVARSSVPQRISVTAIDQISILGGSGGDPLSRGVLGFFDEYRYAKMGLRCSLRNDRFVLTGIEEHEGRDYLVVGSRMPPSVNVVSHNQVISFSEMVRRLSRAASSSGDESTPNPENLP